MTFDDIIIKTKGFMANQEIFNEEQAHDVKTSLDIMIEDIEKMMAEEEVSDDEEKFDDVINGVFEVSEVLLEAPLTNDLVEFVSTYSELLFNWNANTFDDVAFRHMAIYMSRLAETRNALLRNTDIIKDVEERMKDLGGWSPPAYEISKAYFEKLLEENE